MRTIVLVDGFNLYHGMLSGKPERKWLDLFSLFNEHALDHRAEVLEVRYYTAEISSKVADDAESAGRQRTYLSALEKYRANQVKIVRGKFLSDKKNLRLVKPPLRGPKTAHVHVHAEKRTDVSLAVDLIDSALSGQTQQLVVCSNDTDLCPAIQYVRNRFPTIIVGMVAPVEVDRGRHPAKELSRIATWSKVLSVQHIMAARLPEKIPNSSVKCPTAWRLPATEPPRARLQFKLNGMAANLRGFLSLSFVTRLRRPWFDPNV